jgi:hypothetical protein
LSLAPFFLPHFDGLRLTRLARDRAQPEHRRVIQRARLLLALVLLIATAAAGEIRVATLNCLLLFDPKIDHPGKVDDQERMTPEQYEAKLSNLATLIKGYRAVGLQETGGGTEIAALAKLAGMQWAWTKGTDTATGEEVGFLFSLPDWKVTSRGRVPELDRVVSKHLLVEATLNSQHVLFLVVHLIRPIGNQLPKHKNQLAAVGSWMTKVHAIDPRTLIVVMGDTNSTLVESGVSLFGAGSEAGEKIRFAGTHLTNKPFDRLVLLGPGTWSGVELRKPPYGVRPAAPIRRVWTDHYLLGAELRWP